MTTTKQRPKLSTKIHDLGLSVRAAGVIQAWLGSDATLGDLVDRGEAELWTAPNVGPKTVQEVLDVCDEAAHPLPFLAYHGKLAGKKSARRMP